MITTKALRHPNYLARIDNTGASDFSVKIFMFLEGVIKEQRKTHDYILLGDALADLADIYDECSEYGWDGYDATPVTAASYKEAGIFLNTLSTQTPVPEVLPLPDGGIGFQWSNGADRIFTVSTSGKGVLVYAGLLGKGRKRHGTEDFSGLISDEIISNIRQIYF